MSRTDPNAPFARNWRDIPQHLKPRAMSPEGRRRLVWSGFRTTVAIVVFGGLGWGGFEIAATLRGKSRQLSSAAEAAPVKEVDVTTDGVLDKDWVIQTLALPKNASLVELDLYQLRARLTASGQVRTATLTRTFPATLTVRLSERSPMARIMAQITSDETRMFLVGREGTVFEGVGFDKEMLSTLPWLAGVKLTRERDGFLPIAGMETVAELLAKAKLEAEHLYKTWEIVSLARLESDGEIEVRSKDVPRIIFGTNEDFFRQLARLDSLLDAAREKTDRPFREINLSIGAQVPVSFDEPNLIPATTTADATRSSATAKTPALPAFPNLQRKTKL